MAVRGAAAPAAASMDGERDGVRGPGRCCIDDTTRGGLWPSAEAGPVRKREPPRTTVGGKPRHGGHQAAANRERVPHLQGTAGRVGVPRLLHPACEGLPGYDHRRCAHRVRSCVTRHYGVAGIRPRLGRLFNSDESLYPSPDLALLSERYWKVRFAGRADVLGQTLDLLVAGTRRPHRVVGVMAEDVSFPYPLFSPAPDVWANATRVTGRFVPGNNFHTIGLLKPSVGVAEVRAAAAAVAEEIATAHPRDDGATSLEVVRLQDSADRDARVVTGALAVGFIVVTLLGLTNIGHLLLAHVLDGRRDAFVRSALGAGRIDLLARSGADLAVVLAGGVILGFGLTYLLLGWLPSIIPTGLHLPRAGELASDATALVGAVAGWIVLGAALIIVVWALTNNSITQPDTPTHAWARRRRSGRWILGSQLAMAFALVTVALWTASHVRVLTDRHSAWVPEHLLVAELFVPPDLIDSALPSLERLLPSLAGIESVSGAALAMASTVDFTSPEFAGPIARIAHPADLYVVTPGYSSVAGLRTVDGRWLSDADGKTSARVAVVDEALADRHFKGGRVVGTRIRLHSDDPSEDWTVIGVVKSPPSLEPSGIARPAVYVPWAQYPMANVTLMLRTSVAARAVAAQVRDTTAAGLPGGASISRLRTGRDIVAEADARSTFIARQLSALAVIAVLLAFTGLYGVSAHDAALRTREMAVRSALGSTPASLVWHIVRRSLEAVVLGLALGVPLAIGLWKVTALTAGLRVDITWSAVATTTALFVTATLLGSLPVGLRVARIDAARLLATDT